MKWLTISKPYVAANYRDKLHQWSSCPEMENHLIIPHQWGSSKWEVSEEDFKRKLNIVKLPTVFNGRNHFFFFQNLEKTIQKIEPDYLNVEEEHYSLVTYQCLRIARKYQIPMSFYTWQNIFKKYPFPFSYFEKEVFKYCKFAFAGNEEAKEVLRRKSYEGDICVIPQMGIASTSEVEKGFSPQVQEKDLEKLGFSRLKLGGFRFLYAGRMVEEKGLHLLKDAFKQLVNNGRNIRLVLVGSGPLKETLRRELIDHEKEGLVLWIDSIPTNEMFKVYRQSDCLVLPSLTKKNWKEQFGRVLVEAMFYRVLCIGSNSGEIPNVIAENKQIFLENNLESLIQVMSYAETLSPEERSLLLVNHHERVTRLYSNSAIALKQYEFCMKHLNER